MKLEIIDSPTERTTAATDLLLAAQGFIWAWYIPTIGDNVPWQATIWAWAWALIGLGSFLGAIAHGLKMERKPYIRTWRGIALILGLAMGLFSVAGVYDLLGEAVARQFLPIGILISLGFFCFTFFGPETFLVFIVYEAVILILAVLTYSWLGLTGQLPGAWLMVVGVILALIAAVIQAKESLTMTFIWQFDWNGIFHLMQLLSNAVVLLAIRMNYLG